MSKSVTIPRIRVEPDLKARLERLAHDDRRTVSDYVRLVLEQHVKSVECFGELAGEGEFIKPLPDSVAVWTNTPKVEVK